MVVETNQAEGDAHRLGEQLDSLLIGEAGRLDEHGYIAAVIGKEGHVFHGPYLALPAGQYSARMIFAADKPPAGASGDPGLVLEAVNRFEIIASLPLDDASLELGMVALPFTLPGGSGSEQSSVEIRVFSRGKCPLVVTSVDLRRMTLAFRHPNTAIRGAP